MDYRTDRCTYCSELGHTVKDCPRKQARGWTRQIGLAVMAVLVGVAVAQDAEPTQEQVAEKCASEGGCAMFTFREFRSAINEAISAGFGLGVASCARSA